MSDWRIPAGDSAGPPDGNLAAELQDLLPRQSRTRVVIWTAVVVLALVAAWGAPKFLAPDVHIGYSSAQVTFPDAPYLWAAAPITVTGWPSATVTAVADRPGAKVVAAWLTTEEQVQPFMSADPVALEEFTVVTGVTADDLRTVPPALSLDDADTTTLQVLWQITDCDPVIAASDAVSTTVMLQSSWGIKREVSLADLGWADDPLFSFDLVTGDGNFCP